jgi:exopolysaccharide biosynthesis protein
MFRKFLLQSLFIICLFFYSTTIIFAQLKWQNVDSLYQPLPKSLHVYFTDESIDTSKFRAFYVEADLKDENINFTTDTTFKRRLTPLEFYQKNDHPILVVNGTFFSFETNQNLNVVIKDGKIISHNSKIIKDPKDTARRLRVITGAIGINRKRKADVAWIKTDTANRYASASQRSLNPIKTGNYYAVKQRRATGERIVTTKPADDEPFRFWKMKTAIGGGPVLMQKGQIKISNEEEQMFAGKAINDKHPRTAMGYTADNKLIILVVEGRNPNAGGATLTQEAQILKDLGCIEALNLDGGGSSCLLINGKETIYPSDKKQRAVPAVFIIQNKIK